MELPADCDGGPHQVIVLKHTWAPAWKVDPNRPRRSVPPASARRDEGARLPGGGSAVGRRRRRGRPSQRVRRGRHPGHRAGQEFSPSDGELDEDGIAFAGIDLQGLLGSEVPVNGTWGPVPHVP
ncbi:hypothetical protein HBB16_10085 [Pseudonocardia sp. MCCB 268]|nr:hypothetical protein [Pseudonocardia cytotoxica]